MTIRPLVFPLAAVLAAACGDAAPRTVKSPVRSHLENGPVLYDVIDLSGDLGNGEPYAITNDGIVIGTAHDSNGYLHFTYDPSSGALNKYYAPTSPRGGFSRINAYGDGCGTLDSNHAFVMQGGTVTDLGTLGGSSSGAVSFNDAGQAIGTSATQSSSYPAHVFFWDGASMTDIGAFGGEGGKATSINSAGQATGGLETHRGYAGWTHAFLYDHGTVIDLGTLGKSDNPGAVDVSVGRVVNELGHVAGQTSTPAGEHGFLWNGQVMNDLGPTPDGTQVQVLGMNDFDVVVGYYGGDTRAFAYLNGAIVDLNTVAGPTDMVLWRATAVNNNGQIVGYGGTPNSGVRRAFLLQPR